MECKEPSQWRLADKVTDDQNEQPHSSDHCQEESKSGQAPDPKGKEGAQDNQTHKNAYPEHQPCNTDYIWFDRCDGFSIKGDFLCCRLSNYQRPWIEASHNDWTIGADVGLFHTDLKRSACEIRLSIRG